jgi:FkbM family methyltransferase
MNKIEKLLIGPKAVLKSRKLIKNLSSSLYQYLILRKQNIELKLRNGDTITVSRFLYPRIIYYYYLEYLNDINKKEIKIKLGDKTYSVPINALYSNDIGGIIMFIKSNWQYRNTYWEKNRIKFKYAYGSILEIFDNEDYKFLNVQNKSVLDIGAFVGDSPIYFILKGAKKVYAIEPHPDAYNEMLENIKLNNMENKIVPINMGISYEKDYITIDVRDITHVAFCIFKSNNNNIGIKVSAGKLSNIIEKYDIDAQILKMDCEGCEYDIILKDYDTIKEFDEIGFEYHAYNTKIPVSKLLDKLNKDFECKFIKGRINEKIGLIHCIRKR